MRQQIQDSGTELINDQLARGLPLGIDDSGTSYYQVASDAGVALKSFALNGCVSSAGPKITVQ